MKWIYALNVIDYMNLRVMLLVAPCTVAFFFCIASCTGYSRMAVCVIALLCIYSRQQYQ